MNSRLTRFAVCLLGLLAPLLGTPAFCQDQKPQLVVQTGHTAPVTASAISADGKLVATGGQDWNIKIWDVATGQELRTLVGHLKPVQLVTFSSDARRLASSDSDGNIFVWDVVGGGKLVSFPGKIEKDGGSDSIEPIPVRHYPTNTKDGIQSLAFGTDGKSVGYKDHAGVIEGWDIATSNSLSSFPHLGDFTRNASSTTADGHLIIKTESGQANLYNSTTKTRSFRGEVGRILWEATSTDGNILVVGDNAKTIRIATSAVNSRRLELVNETISDNDLSQFYVVDRIKIWDFQNSHFLILPIHSYLGFTLALSRDGRLLAVGSEEKVSIWKTDTGTQVAMLSAESAGALSLAFSSDGQQLGVETKKTLSLWSVKLARSLWQIPTNLDYRTSQELQPEVMNRQTIQIHRIRDSFTPTLSFSPDNRFLTNTYEGIIGLLRSDSGRRYANIVIQDKGDPSYKRPVAIRSDGRIIAVGNTDGTVDLWNTFDGKKLSTLEGHTAKVWSVAFSPQGPILASGSEDGTVKAWDSDARKLVRSFDAHINLVSDVSFIANKGAPKIVSTSVDGTIKYWDLSSSSNREQCALASFADNEWAVTDPQGRFDASPGGSTQMHYVVGLEPIELAQLKDRYYEPGLLAKLLGFNKQPLRDVQAFDHVDLYPSVGAPDAVSADGKLPLTLTSRGGGIGRVQVFVNGKELLADARGPKTDPNAKTATLTVDISHAPGLVPGKPNTVRVVTWNKEGYLSSRGAELVYTPRGQADTAPPDLWAIVGGISDYAGPSLHLTYPAKDAADFAHALTLASRNLFGADKVHLTLLDTGGQSGALSPTKANLQQAFEAARKAKPGDIFVVYLAGHGVALPGPSDASGTHDLYCYLTQDATTGSPTTLGADTSLRQATTVSSEELTDWIKQVPAQKQVMVLDTCAAGAAAALLTAKRDIPSDQIRAIERLKDRTGFYVLMGCAADAASYETSRYRQGLLTYSLLKGMKGASLRDGQYVDVSGLFNYAVDAVPQLAQNIGGVQHPFVAAPQAGSFDVGQLSAADREAIPLASAGVLLLRPELIAEDEDLGLEALLAARLRDAGAASARGDALAPALSFVDASDFPGALRPQGTYTVLGEAVAVKLRLRRDGKVVNRVQVTGTRADLLGLVSKLAAAIIGAMGTP